LRVPKDERGMCPDTAQQAAGPDWLEYNNGSPIRPYYNNLPRGQVDAMISNFSHSVLTQQPGRVLDAYGRDLLKLFALTRHTSQGDTPISRWQFQLQYPYFAPWTSRQVVHTAIEQYGGSSPAVWRPVAQFLRSYQLDGGYTPGPVFAVCLLAGLAGSAALLRRRLPPELRTMALGSLLFLASAVSVLMVSDTFEFSWRYQLPALVTLVPAGALGGTVVARLIQARRAHGNPATDQPAAGQA
jgi:hypothetical protein